MLSYNNHSQNCFFFCELLVYFFIILKLKKTKTQKKFLNSMLNFTLKYIKQKLKRERKIAMKGAKSR